MCEAPRRHRDRDRAQQQADDRGERQESLRAIRGVRGAVAAVLAIAYADLFRQQFLHVLVEVVDGRLVARNEQRISNAAALVYQPGGRHVVDVEQQRRRQRCETDRLIRPVCQHRIDDQLGFADRHRIADIDTEARQDRAIGPHLAARGNGVDFTLLAKQFVRDAHLAAQRIFRGYGLDRREHAFVAREQNARKPLRLGRL